MKFRLIKASDWTVERRHSWDTEDGKEYYYIWGPDGEYCDADGEPYKFDKKSSNQQLDYNRAYNAIQTAIDNNLITDPETEFDDVSYELMEQANIDPDSLTEEEYNYWKDLFLEAWKSVDWKY